MNYSRTEEKVVSGGLGNVTTYQQMWYNN